MKLVDLPNHHAVLILHPDRQTLGVSLWEELDNSIPVHLYVNQSVLDIDTVRNMIAWAGSSYQRDRTAIISFHIAPHAAQNAFLKVLEEPKQGVRFILITSNLESLLETVISRTLLVADDDSKKRLSLAREFLEEKPEKRMKLKNIVELLSQEDEEGRKDRESIRSFILAVIDVLAKEKSIKHAYVKEALAMASYAGDPSTSGKTIVEYLSLLLPQCDTIA